MKRTAPVWSSHPHILVRLLGRDGLSGGAPVMEPLTGSEAGMETSKSVLTKAGLRQGGRDRQT